MRETAEMMVRDLKQTLRDCDEELRRLHLQLMRVKAQKRNAMTSLQNWQAELKE